MASMKQSSRTRTSGRKTTTRAPMHPDRKIILIFIMALAAGFTGVTAVLRLWVPGPGGLELFMAYVWVVPFSFMTAGMAAFKYYRKAGIIRTRRVLRWFAVVSLSFDILFVVALFMQYEAGWFGGPPDPRALSPFAVPAGAIAVPIALFFAFFGILCFFLLTGFGIISVMVALERRLAPEALVRIRRISRGTSDGTREKDQARFLKYSALAWIFDIPGILETRKLRLRVPAPSKRFPWNGFWRAMGWSVLFGTVIAIDISFNPFLRESFSVQQLFSVTSFTSFFIPWLVLPWFIFRRLDAGIPGPSRKFMLYDGLRSRLFGTLVAIGTMITLIRLALRDIAISTIISSFFSYYISFILLTAIFAFVYFNYFEDGLADDVANRYDRLKKKEEGAKKGDEEE